MKKPEILAPAGNLKKIKYALAYGADAVYCGLPDFSLRARVNDFNYENLNEAIHYVHGKSKKIYVTINVFAHNYHLAKLPEHLHKLKKNPPDAIIISDPGILQMVKKELPRVKIFLSTQANCTNWQAVKFWRKQGVSRIILARELTLSEIKEIHRRIPKMELECFVHGAMCMAYSGRCILSKYFTGRSANLGDCTHPCRWQYNVLVEEKQRPKNFLPVYEDESGTYIFNSKDLCLIKYLDELKKAGICSFKIEGRSKSIFYVASAVKAYRLAVDKKENPNQLFKELLKLPNRGYTTGFIFGKEKCDLPAQAGQKTDSAHSSSDYEFVGEVIDCIETIHELSLPKTNEPYALEVLVHNSLKKNDVVEIIQPKGKTIKIKIQKMIDKKTKREIKEAHGGRGQIVFIPTNIKIQDMAILRKK